MLPGFSPGLTLRVAGIHEERQAARIREVVRHVYRAEGQTGAEARESVAFVGRLKPPSSTVVPAFFREL